MTDESISILVAVVAVGVTLGGLILTGNRGLRQDVAQMERRLREDMKQVERRLDGFRFPRRPTRFRNRYPTHGAGSQRVDPSV